MNKSYLFRVSHLFLLLTLLVPQQILLAKSNAKMKVKKENYVKVTKTAFGTKYPQPGPVIHVYTEGASAYYSHIANTHKPRKVQVGYTASCSNRGKLTGVQLRIGTTTDSLGKGGGFKSGKHWMEIPFSEFAAIDAVKLCNGHAKTLGLEKNTSFVNIVKKGFSMKLSNALEASGTAFCKAAGLGKGGVDSDSEKVDAWVVCEPNPKARTGSKSTKTKKHKPDPGKATTIFKTASFKASKSKFSSKCPAPIVYSGSIQAKGKGKIEYQWIGNDNYKSPTKTIAFNGAGSKNFQWTRMIRKPESKGKRALASANSNPNKLKGWMALKVTHKLKNKMAHTMKVWTSKKQHFELNCTVPSKTLKIN